MKYIQKKKTKSSTLVNFIPCFTGTRKGEFRITKKKSRNAKINIL